MQGERASAKRSLAEGKLRAAAACMLGLGEADRKAREPKFSKVAAAERLPPTLQCFQDKYLRRQRSSGGLVARQRKVGERLQAECSRLRDGHPALAGPRLDATHKERDSMAVPNIA